MERYRKMFTKKIDIEAWLLGRNHIHKWTINPDLTVDIEGHIDLRNKGEALHLYDTATDLGGVPPKELPVKFGIVTGEFYCAQYAITNLENIPYEIGTFSCMLSDGQSLSGIHKRVKKCQRWRFSEDVSHLLGVLLVPGCEHIDFSQEQDGGKLGKILRSHIGDQDILACQDELIDAGFTKQARL